jgi:GNAT superfamily N-acetyltransferase
MIYRLATVRDLTDLAEMRWEFRMENGAVHAVFGRDEFVKACAEFFRQALAERRWVFWIAEDQGRIVSHIFVQRVRKVPKPERLHDEYGYVTNVYTVPAFRRKGICTKLMKKVIAWAAEKGSDTLIAWPSEKSVGFYKKRDLPDRI